MSFLAILDRVLPFLKKGENPDNVKLNLVINGTGTVWNWNALDG